MHIAAMHGKEEMAVFLNEQGLSYNVEADKAIEEIYFTPMRFAAQHKQFEMMVFLKKQGLDYILQGNDGEFYFNLSDVLEKYADLTDEMIKAGCNVNELTYAGYLPIMIIAMRQNIKLFHQILETNIDKENGYLVIDENSETRFKINDPTHGGEVLCCAVQCNMNDIAHHLLLTDAPVPSRKPAELKERVKSLREAYANQILENKNKRLLAKLATLPDEPGPEHEAIFKVMFPTADLTRVNAVANTKPNRNAFFYDGEAMNHLFDETVAQQDQRLEHSL